MVGNTYSLCSKPKKSLFYSTTKQALLCCIFRLFPAFQLIKVVLKSGFFPWELKNRDNSGVSFKQRLLPAHLPTPLTAITFPSLLFPGFTDFSLHSRFFFFSFQLLLVPNSEPVVQQSKESLKLWTVQLRFPPLPVEMRPPTPATFAFSHLLATNSSPKE